MSSNHWTDRGWHLPRRMRPACLAGCGIAILLLLGAAAAADDRLKPTPSSWAPPDIDRVLEPVNPDAPCALGGVLGAASQRVQDLVVNMQRFSATEQVAFEEMDHHGGVRTSRKATFSYVAYIHETAPRQLAVEEYRNDMQALQDFPSKVATLGTAAFALIFHPNYLKDFSVTCEGLSEWQGRRAWRLRLVQTQANNFRGYRLANRYFRVMLKARAWIDAETFEVLRLETDLRDPIAEIPLLLEHVIVDYAIVDFPRRNLQLWLPREAEIYMDYRGHRYHHRHSFSHFQLFWVDTEQTVRAPQVAASEAFYPPANTTTKPVAEPVSPAPSAAPQGQLPAATVVAGSASQPAASAGGVSTGQHASLSPSPSAESVFVPATTREAASLEQHAPSANTAPTTTKSAIQPATTREAVRTSQPAPATNTDSLSAKSVAAATQDAASTGQRAPAASATAKSVTEPAVTDPPSLKERPDPAPNAAGTTKPAPGQGECSECLRVLISLRDGNTGMLRDNVRSQAQDDWIRRNAEHLAKGKGASIRVIPIREDAEYNIVWSAGFLQGTPYTIMHAEVVVVEITSGKKVFYASHESRYWEVEHPENTCLQDAITFLKNGQKRPHG